ncbi:hypothetical protein NIES2104_48060 [Leptolyngbya sp. NIES-2104]|nr:hypothetical protein NIES2104_48060 [Leptolyngbya sp. NIES-2104]
MPKELETLIDLAHHKRSIEFLYIYRYGVSNRFISDLTSGRFSEFDHVLPPSI